ncbi:MAG: hypothetical protein LBS09_01605 [Bacteroidales bacterium]|jgi:hypothetical protein|nr:hypothetical protein [Bacteroidales bacterium]
MTYRKADKTDIPALLPLYEQLHPREPAIGTALADEIWKTAEKHDICYFVFEIRL